MPDLAPFSSFPDEARIWIHSADEPLSPDTQDALLNTLANFFERWTSHEHSVQGAATILDDRFLIVAAVRADGGDISGCGIDDLAHAIDDAASALDISWVPALHVLYRDEDGSVVDASRRTFQQRGKDGTVTPNTPVFDPSLTSLGALREGTFERRARDSWHTQLLASPAAS